MLLTFPSALEIELLRYLKAEFYRGTRRENFIGRPFNDADLKFFSGGAADLSRLFTTERGKIDSGYLNRPALRAGYLLYFLPINFGKTLVALPHVPQTLWKKKRLRVLDLGSGPGTASLAVIEALALHGTASEVELCLVDQSENALGDAQHLVPFWFKHHFPGGELKLQKIRCDMTRFRFNGPYDLILMSHCLNELRQDTAMERAAWLQQKLPAQVAPEGVVLITEPALKRPTRELMALRDHLLASGSFQVLAPCLHQEICPMLKATHNDWCHFYGSWSEPAYLQELDRLVKNDNHFLKVAYLVLTPSGDKALKIVPRHDFRIVSNRMATRGKTELVLCGPAGRMKLSRLDRDCSPANEDLDRSKRGDRVRLEDFDGKGYEVERNIRMGKNEGFEILEPY